METQPKLCIPSLFWCSGCKCSSLWLTWSAGLALLAWRLRSGRAHPGYWLGRWSSVGCQGLGQPPQCARQKAARTCWKYFDRMDCQGPTESLRFYLQRTGPYQATHRSIPLALDSPRPCQPLESSWIPSYSGSASLFCLKRRIPPGRVPRSGLNFGT